MSHGEGPCPDGDACPDARRYGSVHPAPQRRFFCATIGCAWESDSEGEATRHFATGTNGAPHEVRERDL